MQIVDLDFRLPEIDNQKSTIYNSLMGGLIQPSPVSTEERESTWRPVLIGVAIVVVVVGVIVLAMREEPRPRTGPPPYAAKLQISDLKMSAAESFVGATVSYLDGIVSNTGDKTLTHAVVRVVFKDDMGEVVGDELLPLHILKTTGPYPDAVDLSASPLSPGQRKPFRLTLESISAQWNHQFPEMRVVEVTTK